MASKVVANASRVRLGKASMARDAVRSSYSSSWPQQVPLNFQDVRPPGWSLRLPPLELAGTRPPQRTVVPQAEPAAPGAPTKTDAYCVYTREKREKVVPADNGLTETMHHRVSQSTAPHNAASVVSLCAGTATGRLLWCGDFSNVSCTRISVSHSGGSDDTGGDTVETEPHERP